jgi:photosystem II S4 domain protein
MRPAAARLARGRHVGGAPGLGGWRRPADGRRAAVAPPPTWPLAPPTRPLTTTAASPSPAALLAHLPPELRSDVTRALELAERAASSGAWLLTHTDFLTPPAAAAALAALAGRADVGGRAWGGHPAAERVRLILGDPDRLAGLTEADLAGDEDAGGVGAVTIRGRFTFEAATHRDFLGAALRGAGLDRRVLGDILLDGERGATLFAVPAVIPALEAGVTGVRGVGVSTTRVPRLADLRLPPPRPPTEVRTTEASLRLDALASAGFKAPRSKMADAIRAGDVKLNWVVTTKAAAAVGAGDVISCAGKGRVEIVGVEATRKGRWAVEMVRYA